MHHFQKCKLNLHLWVLTPPQSEQAIKRLTPALITRTMTK
jgi:hypothetical protein